MKMIKVTPVFEEKDENETNRKYDSMLINAEHISASAVNTKTCQTEIVFEGTMIPVTETPQEIEEMIK